jgi:hypothetical protein
MKIEVFKHEATGRLFENEELFKKFCEEFEEGRKVAEERLQKKQAVDAVIHGPRKEAQNIQDFIRRWLVLWNKENQQFKIQVSKEVNITVNWMLKGIPSSYVPIGKQAHTPAGKKIEHPGWRVILKGRLSTNGQTKSYDLNYLYTLQQNVPGLHGAFYISDGSFHVECYVFAQDLPHVWGRYKEWERELNRKEEELKRLSNEHFLYEGRCQEWVEKAPVMRDIINEIEEARTTITKMQERIKIYEASLVNQRAELTQKYFSEIEPYTLKINELAAEIKEFKSTFI